MTSSPTLSSFHSLELNPMPITVQYHTQTYTKYFMLSLSLYLILILSALLPFFGITCSILLSN